MMQPLVIFVLAFGSGICCARIIRASILFVYCGCVLFLVLAALTPKNSLATKIFLSALFFFLGAACLENSESLPKCHISKYAYYKNDISCTLKGFIVGEPAVEINKTTFVLRCEELYLNNRRAEVCGDTLMQSKAKLDLGYGDALIVNGALARPFRGGGAGRINYGDYLANQGIYSVLRAGQVVKSGRHRGLALRRIALYLKNRTQGIIFKYLCGPAAGIVGAMLLGEKKNVAPLIYDYMIRTGTVHILAWQYRQLVQS